MEKEAHNKKFCRFNQGASLLGLIIFGAIFSIVSVSLVSLKFSNGNFSSGENLFSRTSGVVLKTFSGIFPDKNKKPMLEIDLNKNSNNNSSSGSSKKISNADVSQEKISNPQKNLNPPAQNKSVVQGAPASNSKNVFSPSTQNENRVSVSLPEKKEILPPIRNCEFSLPEEYLALAVNTPAPHHRVIFGEINWAGNEDGADNEWIELKNNSGADIPLRGWQILSKDGNIKIVFENETRISLGKMYLLERTDDNSAPNAKADMIYSGALSNSGAHLKIFDADCNLSDEINASKKWPAGESASRKTMERSILDLSWHTSISAGGTPKKENSTAFSAKEAEISFAAPGGIRENSNGNPSSEENTGGNAINPIIGEIMAGIDGNSSYEFVEFYNPGSSEIDLTDWSIKKKSSTGNESSLVASSRLDGKKIPPTKHFLIANESVSSTIVNADVYWPRSYTLAYSNNAIVVYNASGNKIEEIAWTEIPVGSSYERQPLGGNQFVIQATPNPQNSSE